MLLLPVRFDPSFYETLCIYNPHHWLVVLKWIYFQPSNLQKYIYIIETQNIKDESRNFKEYFKTQSYRSLLLISLGIAILCPLFISLLLRQIGYTINLANSVIAIIVVVAIGLGLSLKKQIALGVVISVTLGTIVIPTLNLPTSDISNFVLGIEVGLAVVTIISAQWGNSVSVSFVLLGGFVAGLLAIIEQGWIDGFLTMTSVICGGLRLPILLLELPFVLLLNYGYYEQKLLKWSIHHPIFWDEIGVVPLPGSVKALWHSLDSSLIIGIEIIRRIVCTGYTSWLAHQAIHSYLNNQEDSIKALYEIFRLSSMNERIYETISRPHYKRIPTVRLMVISTIINRNINNDTGFMSFFERIAWALTNKMRHSRTSDVDSLLNLLCDLEQAEFEQKIHTIPEIMKSNRCITLSDFLMNNPFHSTCYEIGITLNILSRSLSVTSIRDIAALSPVFEKFQNTKHENMTSEIRDNLDRLSEIVTEINRTIIFSHDHLFMDTLNNATVLLDEFASDIINTRITENIPIRSTISLWQVLINQTVTILSTPSPYNSVIEEYEPILNTASSSWSVPTSQYDNPYIHGNPLNLTDTLFVGRRDILLEIAQTWHSSNTKNSIIIFGQRRMGKTSVLRNLEMYTSKGMLLVNIDLQGDLGVVSHLGNFLWLLASSIYERVLISFPDLNQPSELDYENATRARLQFKKFLQSVTNRLKDDQYLIVALDEFEALQDAVNDGRLTKQAYGQIRSLSQHPKIVLIMAGLHTLDEMTHDYHEPFFGSYMCIKISYLDYEASTRLITQPTPNFNLEFAPDVVKGIFELTYGQPMLIQRICYKLVQHINHELCDLKLFRESKIIFKDLESVVNDDFLRTEKGYFEGLWKQCESAPTQLNLLRLLSASDPTVSDIQSRNYDDKYAPNVNVSKHSDDFAKPKEYFENLPHIQTIQIMERRILLASEFGKQLKVPMEQIQTTLELLEKRDLLIYANHRWEIAMPLFKRWIKLFHPIVDPLKS